MQKEKGNWEKWIKASSIYSTGNYSPHLIITYNGKESEKEYIQYIYNKSPTRTFKLWALKEVNMFSISVRHEWHGSLPSVSCCWRSSSSAISLLLSLLHSLLSVHLMPNPCMLAIILYYSTFQGTVLQDLKCLFWGVVFNVLFVWKVL